jgi:hypothetical protein
MPYTDKATVENYLAVAIPDALSASVEQWAEAARTFIYNYTGRYFDAADEDEEDTYKYDGNGRTRLEIDDCISVSRLTIYGIEVTADGYFLYPANDSPKTSIELNQYLSAISNSRSGNVFTFTPGQQNVEVTGVFGWPETPADIVLAATKLVGGIIKEAVGDRDIKEVTRETLGDYQADYAKISDIAHALKVTDLLDPYCKIKSVRTAVNEL